MEWGWTRKLRIRNLSGVPRILWATEVGRYEISFARKKVPNLSFWLLYLIFKVPKLLFRDWLYFQCTSGRKGEHSYCTMPFSKSLKAKLRNRFSFPLGTIIKTFLPYLISSANLRWEKIYSIHKEETLKWPKKTILKKWLNKRKATFFFKEGITQMITYFVIVLKRRMFYLSHF